MLLTVKRFGSTNISLRRLGRGFRARRRSAGEFGDTPIESRTLARPEGASHVSERQSSNPPRSRKEREVLFGVAGPPPRWLDARNPKPSRPSRLRGGSEAVPLGAGAAAEGGRERVPRAHVGRAAEPSAAAGVDVENQVAAEAVLSQRRPRDLAHF